MARQAIQGRLFCSEQGPVPHRPGICEMKQFLCILCALCLCLFSVTCAWAEESTETVTLQEKMQRQIALGSGLRGVMKMHMEGEEGLPALLRKIREMNYKVKLDTNGNHPVMLRQILEEGLADYVAMDIKNSPEKYAQTVGLDSFDLSQIEESMALLLHGSCDYEFRTTVVDELHDAHDFELIGPWIKGARRYFLQCFADRDSVPYGNLHAPSSEKLEQYARIVRAWVPETSLRGV